MAGLIDASTGLEFGTGLQFQTQIGTAGLIINVDSVPATAIDWGSGTNDYLSWGAGATDEITWGS